MKWYYAEDKKPVGPFEASEFLALIANGTIKPDALVWRSGMKAWKPLSEVGPPEVASPEVASPEEVFPEESERRAGSGAAEARREAPAENGSGVAEEIEAEYERMDDKEICAECGRSFSSEDMVKYGDNWICQYCKPRFAQKIREGMTAGGEMEYVGFWVRAGAKIIDIAILWAVGIALSLVVGFLFPLGPEGEGTVAFAVVLNVLQVIAAVGYTTYFLGKYSATPGKMACRLKVVTPEGEPVSYGKGCARYFAEVLSSLIFCIGYLMAIFDNEKRTLHDRIVGTRVVRVV